MRIFRTIGVIGVTTAFFLSSTIALAEERTVPARPIPAVRAVKAEVRAMTASTTRVEAMKEVKEKMETKREEVKIQREEKREEVKTQMEVKREEMKTQREMKREETKEKMETRREEAKNLMETRREEAKVRMEEKRTKAKEHLSEIKDKKKQEVAQRLADQFGNLNKTWTDHFMKQLDQYDVVLVKIQDRAVIVTEAGKDVADITTAIQSANTAIDTARTAVVAQAAKTYVLDTPEVVTTASTTTEVGQEQLVANLKSSFQELHKVLFADLKALRDGSMTDARKSVKTALEVLKKVPAVNDDRTTSATTTTESN